MAGMPNTTDLSAGQATFGHTTGALAGTAGLCGTVYFYLTTDVGTTRYLVSTDGRVLETTEFERSPSAAIT